MGPPVTAVYRRDEVIGRGNFGVVYKGVNKETKHLVAIKVLNLDTIEDDLLDIQQEISTLSQLSQSDAANITKYYGSYLHGTKLWIIMDLCAGGSVRTLLKAGKFEERHIAVVAREVCIALQYIHREGIIHRDIKAANILITAAGSLRLCDFGVAAKVTAAKLKRSTIVGTPYWMAPEVITEGALYNTKADIWSFGVTMFEIATGNPPYAEQEAFKAIMLIPRQKPARLEGSQYSVALKEFVAMCLDEHPDERPSAEELLKSRLVKNTRGIGTLVLKEVVQRYMLWRREHNVRDSIALAKGIKEGDDESDFEDDEDEDSELWDFDTSDMTTFDYGSMTPIATSPEYSADEHQKTLHQKLNGLGVHMNHAVPSAPPPSAPPSLSMTASNSVYNSHVSTMRAATVPAPALDPSAPKSISDLFSEEYPAAPPQGAYTVQGGVTGVIGGAPHMGAASMPPPATPTVEIEIPNFDAMENENMSSMTQSATQHQHHHQHQLQHQHQQHVQQHAIQLPPPPQSQVSSMPPPVPPQSAQRSRSNTLSNTLTPSSLSRVHVVPPIPPLPPTVPSSVSSTGGSTSVPIQPSSNPTMLPPTMPHAASSTRRTPSPKRMTPKTITSSPPKPSPLVSQQSSSSMKPIVRSKLHNETAMDTDSSISSPSSTASSSPPLEKEQKGVRKASIPRHINMPPPTIPFQSSPLSARPPDIDGESLGTGGASIGATLASATTSVTSLASGSGGSVSNVSLASMTMGAPLNRDISFPPLPKLDLNLLLDTTGKAEVLDAIDGLLDGLNVGLQALEEGLYNFVV